MTQRIPPVMIDTTGATNGHVLTNQAGTPVWVAAAGGGSGTVTGVGGTAPIQSSGGTSPVISIVPATTSVPGSMSAADKTKLDGIATGATANTGTVTAVSVATANGISGSSSGGATPALTLSLGAITPTSITTATVNHASGLNLQIGGSTRLALTSTGAAVTGTITAANHLTTMSAFCSGKPAVSEVVGGQIFPVATTITAASCSAKATVAATASTVFTIAKDGAAVGTITFAASATLATVSISAGAITALQNVTITAPATADATLANISFLVRA